VNWDDVVPCPTCWLPADLVAPAVYETDPHSVCPKGHDNTLIPAVLAHLRTLQEKVGDRPA